MEKTKNEVNGKEESNEGSQFQKSADKAAKLNTSGKRYSLLDNKSAGNSPKVGGGTAGVSKYGEETKSPK